MHTQKKGLSRVEQAGEGGKRTVEEERSWSNKDGGRRGRCRLPTDLRDHSLLLFSFLSLRSIPILVFFPCDLPFLSLSSFPSSRLVTLPVPPVSRFAVHRNARVLVPSFSIDLLRDTAAARTDWFSVPLLLPVQPRAYLSQQLLLGMPFHPPSMQLLLDSYCLRASG